MFNVNNVKKYLPLGTVCLLKDASKKVMIIGFAAKGQDLGDKVFDYIGCIYPEGILNSKINLLFNHNDIQEVYFIGYSNADEKAFKQRLEAFTSRKNKIENSNSQINNNNVANNQNNNSLSTNITSDNANNQINNSQLNNLINNNNETNQN